MSNKIQINRFFKAWRGDAFYRDNRYTRRRRRKQKFYIFFVESINDNRHTLKDITIFL